MKIEAFELRRIVLPLVAPFRTSFGTQTARDILLVHVMTPESDGWGECVALSDPVYSAEYVLGAQHVIEQYLAPALLGQDDVRANRVVPTLAAVQGHRMAKAAVEMAVLDAELRSMGRSWAEEMGATVDRVPAGVSIGIFDEIDQLLEAVGRRLDEGYVRIKLKIEPGWDVEPVAAVRDTFGDVPLQVDANTAYTLADARHLAQLDAFDLLLIEQPFNEDSVRAHARLRETMRTPICLDESILSAESCADAIAMRAVDVVNIKPGRVGGYLEARRIAEVCRANGVPAWCGGMVETGLGRAANTALAAHPAFVLPGDISAAARFWDRDIVLDPIGIEDGHVHVPTGPGLGVVLDQAYLDEVTAWATTIRRADVMRP